MTGLILILESELFLPFLCGPPELFNSPVTRLVRPSMQGYAYDALHFCNDEWGQGKADSGAVSARCKTLFFVDSALNIQPINELARSALPRTACRSKGPESWMPLRRWSPRIETPKTFRRLRRRRNVTYVKLARPRGTPEQPPLLYVCWSMRGSNGVLPSPPSCQDVLGSRFFFRNPIAGGSVRLHGMYAAELRKLPFFINRLSLFGGEVFVPTWHRRAIAMDLHDMRESGGYVAQPIENCHGLFYGCSWGRILKRLCCFFWFFL